MDRAAVTEAQHQRSTPKRRSPRHVKAASRILHKEARRIVRKHARRLPPAALEAIRASVRAIETELAAEQWERLEDEAEVLDELLHQHASFARKSALRETLENIAIAVGVAIGLRSCFYEPFKIPSGSMMPTLRTGDHIFVNKYVYGVQIPFTTTVVGEDLFDHIHRGDVIVFRYPLDPSEDFIKRVVGLPRDVVRVEGRDIWIQRGGEGEFEPVQRKPVERDCLDEAGTNVVEHCRIFEEELDGRTYEVRYLTDIDPRSELGARTFAVPEDRLLVMGDNRNLSHDSLQWTATVEAVSADSLLTVKDMRDLTAETLFTISRPRGDENNEDPGFDSVLYLADHRAPSHDLQLELWRAPSLGSAAVFEAVAGEMSAPARTDIAALLGEGEPLQDRERDRALELAAGVGQIAVADGEDAWEAVWTTTAPETVFRLHCGKADCRSGARLAKRVTEVVGAWQTDHELEARELIEGSPSVRYSQHWRAREETAERFVERVWGNPTATGPQNELRLRAWRTPEESTALVRAAALHAVGTEGAEALAELGEDAWLVQDGGRWSVVVADHEADMVVLLECGKRRCKTREDALELATHVREKLPAAASDRHRMSELLGQKDVGAWPERPVSTPKLYEWDRVTLQGTVRGGSHTLSLRIRHKPEIGLEAAASAWKDELEAPEAAPNVGADGWYGHGPGGHRYVFTVPQSETVIALHCAGGLCPDRGQADRLAQRVAEKALDPGNFVDPSAERHQPYVPRGNVKGRAERIWLPFSRLWLKVR